MQQGFLFHHVSGLAAGVDLEQIVIHLSEPLDRQAFGAAFRQLIARHPVLRTRFRWEDVDEPVQEVLAEVELHVDECDLGGLSVTDFETEVEAYVQRDRERGFDLRVGPPLRVGILHSGDSRSTVVWSFPHIVLDGRSFPLVLRELFALYDAARGGAGAADLAGLPERRPFREYVAKVAGRDLSEAESFWRERLAGLREATPLPGTPAEPGTVVERRECQVRLSRSSTDHLRELAKRHTLSLNSLLQGAWAILLSRYSGQQDVVFAATRAGRSIDLDDANAMVGVFINTLPVRVQVARERALIPWLAELRSRERAVREHEHTPLVELQRWSDVPAGTPLFESLIVFDHETLDSAMRRDGAGFENRRFELRERTNFPLTLYGYAEPEMLLKLAYDKPRFDDAGSRRMLGNLVTLLEAMAKGPERRLGELPMLAEAERHRTLVEWNDTDKEYPREVLLHQLIESQVDRTPEAPALSFEGTTLSYSELDRRSNQLAHRLSELGVGPDVLVGLFIERSTDLVVSVLAVHKAGGAYVPLDPAYPRDRIAYMLEDAGVAVVITQSALASELPVRDTRVISIDSDEETARFPTTRPEVDVRSEHLAYVIYTSGSTGNPKGVMVEHRNVVNFFAGMDDWIPHEDPGVWLSVTSLSFDISVLELCWTLARGFHVVVQGDEARDAQQSRVPRLAGERALSYGLFYFAAGHDERAVGKYDLLIEGAKYADEHGFAAVWTPERHFHAFGGLYPNPAVTGAALATITKNVQIRAGSVVLPLHHPARVAEEWALVDNLSGGRVGVSFASGWQPNDFVLRPENYADAKATMFREIETVRKLWRGEAVEFLGPAGDPVETRTLPRPIQSDLPIWITSAGSPETFRQAGAIGANVLTHLLGQTIEEVAERIHAYREAWDEAGFPPGRGQVSMMLHTFIGDDTEQVREVVRRPMMDYLASSIGLIRGFAGSWSAFKKRADGTTEADVDLSTLSPEDMEDLVAYSFERYFETSALFGSVDHCAELIDRLAAIGVDDIACLIDFGVDTETVLAHLPNLTELKEVTTNDPEDGADYRFAAQVARHGVTHLQCTPSMARMLTLDEDARPALRDLQVFLIGGEALPVALANEVSSCTSARVLNMYGPTETTIWSSVEEVAPAAAAVTIGRPIANTQLYILDTDGNPVPVGVVGELYIGGDGVVRGYLDRPDLTAERFLPDPFQDGSGTRMYRTGDLARWQDDGSVEFIGRVDHQVKVRGYRVELGEIEALLNAHPAVREAVVVPREKEAGDQRLVAYVIPQPGDAPASRELREHLRGKLPEFMLPAHFVCLDAFPQTPNQKVDRDALPDPSEVAASKTTEHRSALDAMEETIAGVWEEVLGIAQVEREDNFFDLGGHSLLALKTHRLLVAELGVTDLKITDLFRFPTVRSLRDHLSNRGADTEMHASRDRARSRREAMTRRRSVRSRRGQEERAPE